MCIRDSLDPLLARPALVVEGDDPLGRSRQVGDDESNRWIKLARVPLDLRHHAARCLPALRLIAEVGLHYTVPQYGGRRWWFLCPLTGNPVAKLYLPLGQRRFASRPAHSLTYSSSRKSRSKSKTWDVTLRYVAKMRERNRSGKPI